MSHALTIDRIIWADACRVLAVFGVIVLHASGEVFYGYGKVSNDYWLSANFWDSLFRVAVPLFAMLSGFLLLKSDQQLTFRLHSVVKRVGRVFIPLLTWSVIYLLWLNHAADSSINLMEWLHKFLAEPVMYHLWFVYMIVGLYILIPILQVIFHAIEADFQLAWYFFGVWFVINSLSIYVDMPFLLHMQINSLLNYPGYFILGGVLGNINKDRFSVSYLFLLWLAAFVLTFVIVWLRTYQSGIPNELGYNYFAPNVLVASIAVFLLVKKIRLQGFMVKIVHYLSDISFPVYLVHIISMEYMKYGVLGIKISTKSFHPLLSIPVMATAVFSLSLVVAFVLRLIPNSRKIFG